MQYPNPRKASVISVAFAIVSLTVRPSIADAEYGSRNSWSPALVATANATSPTAEAGAAAAAAGAAGAAAGAAGAAAGAAGAAAGAAGAAASTSGNSGASQPSTGLTTGRGDILYTSVDTPKFTAQDDTGSPKTSYCVPAHTALVVTGVTADGTIYFVRLPESTDAIRFKGGLYSSESRNTPVPDGTPSPAIAPRTSCDPTLYPHQTSISHYVIYEINKSDLDSHPYDAAGIEYGLLIAPYKFHFSDKTIGASATVGPYVGYHLLTPGGSAISEVLSIGLGNVPVTTESTPPGNPKTSTNTSLSLATGFIVTLTKSGTFQLGFLVGIDWAGSGSQYKYEGKPWFGVGFGTALTK